ncbi:MAG TPA: hypothetical protein VHY91_16695 [Pirellulales bacterium]|jgi:ribosomal protein S27E|nr:hypothetical protein [Pirellulales bacterium]
MEYQCPGCRSALELVFGLSGHAVKCPICGAEHVVPSVPGRAAAPTAAIDLHIETRRSIGRQGHGPTFHRRYVNLERIATWLKIMAWLNVLAPVLLFAAVVGFDAVHAASEHRAINLGVVVAAFIVSGYFEVLGFVIFVLLMAAAELIWLAIDIEDNTRRAASASRP